MLRGWYKWKYRVPWVNSRGEEPQWLRHLRIGMFLAMTLSLVDFFVFRSGLTSLPLAGEIRFFGAGVSLLSLVLLTFVHRDLGKQFSTALEVQETGTLVTTGVYRWVRHPMYTVYFLLMFGGGLLSAHGGFLVFSLGIISSLIVLRVPYEEAMLAREFGDQWTEYCETTGRFTPIKALAKQVGIWITDE